MSAVLEKIDSPATTQTPAATDRLAEVTEIIARAEKRARERGLSYRGQLTPDEAWTLQQQHPRAKLIDVRSREELSLIGSVPGALAISWKFYPDWRRNPDFVDEVKASVAPTDLVLLLCRSGVRSREAAELLVSAGYANCFNVLEGFEGDKNSANQRVVAGWKARGLPWSH